MAEPYDRSTTIDSLIRVAVADLQAAGVDSPILDAQVLLSNTLDLPRTHLIAHPDQLVSCDLADSFHEKIRRRANREPLAYIVGEREFYGRAFVVSPAVLIPRPETELLVDLVRSEIGSEDVAVADIGVGSGAIAVSIAASSRKCVVYGTDCSADALKVARRNASRYGVADRVHLKQGNLFEGLEGKEFDFIVSNPPYIPTEEIQLLQPEIALYEPRIALDGGRDGLAFYPLLVAGALEHLNANGKLAIEVAAGQASEVVEMFMAAGFSDVESLRDFSGIERVVVGRKGRAR